MEQFDSKDPEDKVDYVMDWTTILASDTIATIADTRIDDASDDPLTISTPTPSNDDTTTTVWCTGGTKDTNPVLTVKVTTAGGRTLTRSGICPVRESSEGDV